MQCAATTKSGKPCKKRTQANSKFCGVHAKQAADVEPSFEYDVFLSYSTKDKKTVHALAKRLKKDGVRVWLDDWVIQSGEDTGKAIARGVEKSRTLVICMSPDYFESEWGNLEHHSMLFRDPTNAKRRFLPLLIRECNIPDIIGQFSEIDWRTSGDAIYAKLLRASARIVKETTGPEKRAEYADQFRMVLKGHYDNVYGVTITPDGKTVVSGSVDTTLKLWDLETGLSQATLEGHTCPVFDVALSPDGETAISCSSDESLKVWDLASRRCRATLEGHTGHTVRVAIASDGRTAVSGSKDETLKVWNLETGNCLATMCGHEGIVLGVVVLPDGKTVVSGSTDKTLKVWNIETGNCLATFKGHSASIRDLAISPDGEVVVSGSDDKTLKVWNAKTGNCYGTFEGHTGAVSCVAFAPNGRVVVSGSSESSENTLKVWNVKTGQCYATFEGHTEGVSRLAFTPNGKAVVSGSMDNTLRVWNMPDVVATADNSGSPRYTNAKVVLVGESGTGKTGLALRLAEDRWQETESTHGMNVWPLKLPGLDAKGIEREVWLWDFAGQPDYRLIHQLYMDETALALLVIDPQRDNPFAPLEHWEKALAAAVKHDPAKLLVAARCDRGGFTISQKKIDQHCDKQGYAKHLTTAAKSGDGCDDLKSLIADHIPWDRLPWTATSKLFKTLKDAILAVKEEGMALTRVSELRQRLQLELQDESIEEAALRTVVGLLESQGIVKKLDFGDFVLLQPALINDYGSAIVRCARENSDEIGCVPERDILEGDIDFKDMDRLSEGDEKILLRATVQMFLDRSLCSSVDSESGTQLVFPSYFKLDRPEAPNRPPVVVTYGFQGPLDEIYSTLVVRLHYIETFETDELWHYAADFKTPNGKTVGLYMNKKNQGAAEIEVYFEPDVATDSKVSFIKYIHEHLKKHAQDVTRVRSYVCTHCDEPMENKRAIAIRISKGLSDALCGFCEERVELNDLIETKFASDEFLRTVQHMDAEAQINLDNESRELILVGHAFSITGEAGQIFRPTPNSDWGIDGEIEFKDTEGNASGQRVYLQLKSGDSYLYDRKRDNAEIFTIKKERQAEYWSKQAYPVMLVIRTSDGEIRWMNVTEYLRQKGTNTKQVIFEGEAFTAANVAKMRNRLLDEEGKS